MTLVNLFLTALVSLVVVSASNCAVNNQDKVDCGYPGVDQSSCEAKSCCWQTSSYSGVPWCFTQGTSPKTCFGYQSSMSEPFSSSEMTTMRNYFLANINIQGSGGIVASTSKDHVPDYYFHWMRDGALSMRALLETNNGTFASVEATLKAYVQWVIKVQNEADPNGIDIRIEPKFELPGGAPYTGGWCRPQNDGPGLRATTLMIAAAQLIAAGETDYVRQYLWTGDASKYHGGAIKFDLDYETTGYTSKTCDLWEELEQTDLFWNRITTKKALILGSSFATQMGDASSSSRYLKAAQELNASLYSGHVVDGFVQECPQRVRDSAVIVALNDGYDASDGALFSPTSKEVANTVLSYNGMFCSEYSINSADYSKGLPGVLYGRYQGDSYFGGNPWVLSTAALASLFYRGAIEVLTSGVPASEVLSIWQQAFNAPSALPSDKLSLAKVFAQQGDGVLLRLRAHVTARGFHLDEQIDRNTGAQISAEDLTWSYAEVLNAMHWRSQYLAKA